MTCFVWMNPATAEIRERRMVGNTEQLRVKHPDMPGVRWLNPSTKGNGHFSRNDAYVCYFLPTADAWEAHLAREASGIN